MVVNVKVLKKLFSVNNFQKKPRRRIVKNVASQSLEVKKLMYLYLLHYAEKYVHADLNRLSRNQTPLYDLEGQFERINQHPNAGGYSFSIGITEVLNTNLVIELSAKDVEG
ncbi:protein HAPLESS 2-like isoform X1 [Arachis ipaensis]|uniref:protein HAPLESS 2-like isoform X1 n=1 Tax=Arachis ipaensis TaxID=130454 RepID=UPI0007AF8EE3|nr:protein HAPLESS 2-like isoform X1 [Arachis ipaensis]XP_025681056.1 protein HAPLESS 2 isoform X1 [Arachis hypogaea]